MKWPRFLLTLPLGLSRPKALRFLSSFQFAGRFTVILAAFTAICTATLPSQNSPIADPHFARGIEYQQKGEMEQAIQEYQVSLKKFPRYPVWANLGSVYAGLGRYEEAISCYEEALKLAPGQPGVTLNLGLAHYKMGDLPKAMVAFDEVSQLNPENRQASVLLADCYFQTGELKKVIAALEPIEPKHPQDFSIAYLLGTAYLRTGQAEKGQRLVDRILRMGDTAEAHLMLGTALAEIHKNKEAVAEFEKALELNSKLPQLHSSLGLALIRGGDREGALPHFQKELEISPNDFMANFYCGLLHRRGNRDAEALPYLLRARQLRPANDTVALQIGLVRLQEGKLDEARQLLEEVVSRAPDFMDAHVTLARVYYRKKMKTEGDRQQEIVEKLRMEAQQKEPGSKKSAELSGEISGNELTERKASP